MRRRYAKKLTTLALTGVLLAPLAACESQDGVGVMGRPGWGKTETGAVIGGATGAAAGAAIGNQSDNTGKGALIGGAAGALIGGAVGREMEKRDAEQQRKEQKGQQPY
jgi:uncharacterized protein YcfJ